MTFASHIVPLFCVSAEVISIMNYEWAVRNVEVLTRAAADGHLVTAVSISLCQNACICRPNVFFLSLLSGQ
jgi:hypothetical protein